MGLGEGSERGGCISQDPDFCLEIDERQTRAERTHVEFGASPPKLDAIDFEDLPHLQDDSNHTLLISATQLPPSGPSAGGTS